VVNTVGLSKAKDLALGDISTLAVPDLPLLQLHQLESELERLLDIGIVASHLAHGQAKPQ
jgi:hypothetical protein